MKFFSELLGQAGLTAKTKEVLVIWFGSALAIGAIAGIFTGVPALGVCLALLALAAGLEYLRLRAQGRQRMLDQGWPQVFESFQSGIQSGMPIFEQFENLGRSGPASHRPPFFSAWQAFEVGHDLGVVLSRLKVDFSSRAGDLLVTLLQLDSELGGVGMEKTFGHAANSVRKEQAELGQLLAKQGWVALSAKIALFAPWLVALVLLQIEQNRQAFASVLGSLILVLGLTLSLFAYFLVNKLGFLPLPMRVLNGAH